MSGHDAEAFLERNETDEAFANEMAALGGDPDALLSKAREQGYDFTPDEVLEALTERYGVELSAEQLDQIAAGDDASTIAAGVIGGTVMVAAVASVAAAAA